MADITVDLTWGNQERTFNVTARKHAAGGPEAPHLKAFVALTVDVRGPDGAKEESINLFFYTPEQAHGFAAAVREAVNDAKEVGLT